MVEHDMNIVFDIADRISVLVYGEIIASDSPQAIRQTPKCRRPTSVRRHWQAREAMMLEVSALKPITAKVISPGRRIQR